MKKQDYTKRDYFTGSNERVCLGHPDTVTYLNGKDNISFFSIILYHYPFLLSTSLKKGLERSIISISTQYAILK
jgi:hypothetical protein